MNGTGRAGGDATTGSAETARYLRATARGFGGAIIFAFPLLMTMEMWWLGFYMDRVRLLVFLLVSLPILTGLAHYSGLRDSFDWREHLLDALTAFAIGAVTAAVMLLAFGAVATGMPVGEIVGKIAVQTVPAAIGAMLARTQLGSDTPDAQRRKRESTYTGSMFLMGVGALFLAFNVAPTEEMILIAYRLTAWHGLALMALSIVVIHSFVYVVGFYGQEDHEYGFGQTLYRFSIAGYAISLLVSLFVLWMFGRTDDRSLLEVVMPVVVLGFPAALGAATARLIL